MLRSFARGYRRKASPVTSQDFQNSNNDRQVRYFSNNFDKSKNPSQTKLSYVDLE